MSETLIPLIFLDVGGTIFETVVDTGFNGYLELPNELRATLGPRYAGRVRSLLAGGQQVEEDVFLVDFAFDGEQVEASVTFVDGNRILLGTQMLRNHRLAIDFQARTVTLERA